VRTTRFFVLLGSLLLPWPAPSFVTVTLDKILRYETELERQMYRAMAQFERVQRMRRCGAIPAPLSVEVSDRG
jgi:hypothetical protein